MEKIIDPVDPRLIEAELTPSRRLRRANKGNNILYVIDAHTAPHTMREIGRIRELSFRGAGGGTGLACDIDEFDTMAEPCRQLIVWDPEAREILGGYRFILGEDIVTDAQGRPRIATSHMFSFSPEFLRDYLPRTLELGRSFVAPPYQSSKAGSRALYTLDNLWDGLGALTVLYPQIEYLFGKVTMYPGYRIDCRDLLLGFLYKHFPDPDHLVRPITPLPTRALDAGVQAQLSGTTFKEDYKILNHAIREQGLNIPPLVNAYMALSPTMRVFGTAINDEFGNVEETGIFLKISEIFEEKKNRHIRTFTAERDATGFHIG